MWRIGLAFLFGHCFIHALAELPSRRWAIALLAAAGLALVLRSRLLVALLAGIAWAWLNAALHLAGDLPKALEGRDLSVRGYIASLPQASGDAQFVLDTLDPVAGVPSRVRLTWYRGSVRPQPGELWQLRVRLKRRNGFANPGGFDRERHLFREGVGASGYVREHESNRRLRPASYRYAVTRLRAWFALRIAQAAGKARMLGVLQGLAVGDTQAMTAEQWRVFAATGTTHLMAISGLHVGMVAALAAWFGGGIVRWRGAQARGWTTTHGRVLAGVSAALSYSLLAGMSVPTQRTLLMLCIYFASRWWRRELTSGHALGLALVGVLLIDPFAPLAAGAWLSFGAVGVILLAVSGRIDRAGPIISFTRVQAAITIGLAPLLLGAFGGLSVISPLANALAVPLFTLVIVPAVLLGTIAAAIWLPAGTWLLALPLKLLDACWPVLEWLSAQPWSLWYFPQPPLLVFVALLAGALLLILPGIWPTRLAGALLCLPVMVYRPPGPPHGGFELTLLDVGQGLSAVVKTRAHVLVYDAGPAFQSGRDAGEIVVLPFLRHRGVRQLDALVISHGDLDHRGGMSSVLGAMPVRKILAGPTVVNVPGTAPCRRGQQWIWDGVKFEILHPGDALHARDNDSSCVLRVEGVAGTALLSGDIEGEGERELLRAQSLVADVVVVPHHGSLTSSSVGFVAALGAKLALFSAGYLNRWELPRRQVVSRWEQAGARTLMTARSGAIEVSFPAAGPLRVAEYRRTHRRYWHRREGPP